MYVCMYVGMCEAAFISFSCVPFVPRLVMVRICHRWKNKAFQDFPSFSRTWIFFSSETFSLIFFLSSSLLFSSLTLPISAFHLSILSEV